MSASYRKGLRKLAKRYGRRIETGGSGHLRLVADDGRPTVFCSYSPRGGEAVLGAVERDLRRAERAT